MKAKGVKAKAKGVVLLEAFLALLLMAMASYGLATVNSVQFSQMAAGKDADNARNYAELEATYIKQLGYESVVTNNKDDDDTSRPPRYPSGQQSTDDKASNARDMAKFLGSDLGAEWRSTVTLGKSIGNINGDSDNKIQNVVVSVYKASDGDSASPRATVTVPLSTQGSSGSGGEAIGTIVPRYNANFVSDSEKKKYLFCDGSTYNSTAYPKLYKVLGTNKLPKLNDNRFLQGSISGGTYKEAGLPNITATWSAYESGGYANAELSYTGAVYATGRAIFGGNLDSHDFSPEWAFDASRSNPIYGRSSTVQPPAMTVRFYIRAK